MRKNRGSQKTFSCAEPEPEGWKIQKHSEFNLHPGSRIYWIGGGGGGVLCISIRSVCLPPWNTSCPHRSLPTHSSSHSARPLDPKSTSALCIIYFLQRTWKSLKVTRDRVKGSSHPSSRGPLWKKTKNSGSSPFHCWVITLHQSTAVF